MFKKIASILIASGFLAGCITSPLGRSQFIFMLIVNRLKFPSFL